MNKRIAIIGGGISGLAAAWQCRNRASGISGSLKITLFESGTDIGGVLQTERAGGYLIERSADMFTTEPDVALRVCRQLGTEGQLIGTEPVAQRAYVATEKSMVPVPQGLSLLLPTDAQKVAQSALLDAGGQTRFLDEESVAPRMEQSDESLQAFAIRRFGQQFFERIVQPLVGGIYTADPRKLSMRAALLRFIEMEQEHGSLIAAGKHKRQSAADANASGARYSIFRAPSNGMGMWIDWLHRSTRDIETRTSCRIDSIQPATANGGGNWLVQGESSLCESFDAVILATPAKVTARIIRDVDSQLQFDLDGIEAASSAVVVLALDNAQIEKPFDGFGIVTPACLGRRTIALSFSSNKFAGRAPDGKTLIRCFIGGALQGDLLQQDDNALTGIALEELNLLLGVKGTPELTRVFRWNNCMPQYHVGHLDRVARIDAGVAKFNGLELTGNSYRGVGIPVCLESSIAAADRTLTSLINQ